MVKTYIAFLVIYFLGIIVGRYTKKDKVCSCKKCKKPKLPDDMVTGAK